MSFDNDLESFAKASGLELELVVRKFALIAHKLLTEKTPVDKGRARANWNVNATSPDLSTTNETVSNTPNLKKGDGDGAIFITNNLPYIDALEDGHSRVKAPYGMVAITMLEIEDIIKNVIR